MSTSFDSQTLQPVDAIRSGRVSVIIPTYNRREYIAEAVDSVLIQDHPDMEILVVDDGSQDGTSDYLRTRYENEPRLRCLGQANKGQAAARNAALRIATGEFIAFLDSDDLWLPGKLQTQLAVFASDSRVELVHGGVLLIDADGQQTGAFVRMRQAGVTYGDSFDSLVLCNRIMSPTVVVRNSAFRRAGVFSTEPWLSSFGVDWEMWIRVAHGGWVEFCPSPVACYRCGYSGNSERPLTGAGYLLMIRSVLDRIGWSERRRVWRMAKMRYRGLIDEAGWRQRPLEMVSLWLRGVAFFGPGFALDEVRNALWRLRQKKGSTVRKEERETI